MLLIKDDDDDDDDDDDGMACLTIATRTFLCGEAATPYNAVKLLVISKAQRQRVYKLPPTVTCIAAAGAHLGAHHSKRLMDSVIVYLDGRIHMSSTP